MNCSLQQLLRSRLVPGLLTLEQTPCLQELRISPEGGDAFDEGRAS